MRVAEKVVDGLNRIECGDRHFDKHCIPVAHGTVLEAGKFQGTEFLAVL